MQDELVALLRRDEHTAHSDGVIELSAPRLLRGTTALIDSIKFKGAEIDRWLTRCCSTRCNGWLRVPLADIAALGSEGDISPYSFIDGRQAIPPLFYPMLNKCLAVPVLEEWVGYWRITFAGENGRERNLITLLNNGEGQGRAAGGGCMATNHSVWVKDKRYCVLKSCFITTDRL